MHKILSAGWRLAGGGVVALSVRLGAGLALLLAWLAFNAGPAASWVNVAALYEMLVKTHLATPVPSNAEDVEQAGDLIFFDWYNTAGVYNHVGMVIGGKGTDRNDEVYTSHTNNHFTEMSKELEKYLPVSLGIPRSESARGIHWNWHILRMVHTIAYVP